MAREPFARPIAGAVEVRLAVPAAGRAIQRVAPRDALGEVRKEIAFGEHGESIRQPANVVNGKLHRPAKFSARLLRMAKRRRATKADLKNALMKLLADAGSQRAAAKQLGISAQYLCDILAGRKDIDRIGPSVLAVLGFARASKFVRVSGD